MHFSGHLDAETFWARIHEIDERLRRSFAERACYGVAGWEGLGTIGEWSLGDSTTRSLRFTGSDVGFGEQSPSAPFVVVMTTDDADPEQQLLSNLAEARRLGSPADAERSAPGELREPDGEVLIEVDHELTRFSVWRESRRFFGLGAVGSRSILLEAAKIDLGELRLRTVDDIEPFIETHEALIRRRRGEETSDA